MDWRGVRKAFRDVFVIFGVGICRVNAFGLLGVRILDFQGFRYVWGYNLGERMSDGWGGG